MLQYSTQRLVNSIMNKLVGVKYLKEPKKGKNPMQLHRKRYYDREREGGTMGYYTSPQSFTITFSNSLA